MRLSPTPVAADATITYEAMGDGVTFSTPPLETRNRNHRARRR